MWAHSVNSNGVRHELQEHLRSVAALAGEFAAPFGISDLAWWSGLVHDGGKAWCAWQDKLLRVEAAKGRVGLDHKSYGVHLAHAHGLKPVEWVVAGHHGGLTSAGEVEELREPADEDDERLRAAAWADAEKRLRVAIPEMFSKVPALPEGFAPGADPMAKEFLVRFLFSCLVDADVLDTQAHFESCAPRLGADLDASAALTRFLDRRAEFLRKRPQGRMDDKREQVFQAALAAASHQPGIFRLTAPTGTAKTLAAGAFALQHAALHNKRRVIVAVPFITITEQNAAVYRDLLDPTEPAAPRLVLEHHSHVELDDPDERGTHHSWHRLAAENWDAPFIVTTTVQLFESLFGRTGSKMRKLHRIANSVLILDEVQALPHRLLPQVADALRILSEHFGVTVVLSSATQPEMWEASFPDIHPREIVPAPAALFAECRRVRYEWRTDPKPTLAVVVAEALTHPQALLVVNTVRDAQRALKTARTLAGAGVTLLHLSTGMCAAHRRQVLGEVKSLLQRKEPLLLVSTSLIEAGVDLDFPVAFRAIGPPESIAQVAGRCNREGNLGTDGLVVVFDPADGGMPPSYRTQIDKARQHFGPDLHDPEDLDALSRYFPALYDTLGINRDKSVAKVIGQNRRRWDFRSVADGPLTAGGSTHRDRELAFRLIVEDTVPVVVPYGDAAAREAVAQCLASLRGAQPDKTSLRQLQPYLTTLRRRTAQRPDIAAQLAPVIGDLVEWRGSYDDGFGIVLEPETEDFLL